MRESEKTENAVSNAAQNTPTVETAATAQSPETATVKKAVQSPEQKAKEQMRAVRARARADIADIRHALMIERLNDNKKAIDKACRKENLRRYREAKEAAYAASPKRYSIEEEIFNSITHGIGAGLAIAALVLLLVRAVSTVPSDQQVYYVVGCAIFGSSLVLLYLMSTLYHALTPYPAKKVFAIFDHVSIYILIAGTYTPFCLTALQGAFGWTVFGIIWGLALVGVVCYSIFGSRMRVLSAVTYVLMSWLIIFAIKPMGQALSRMSLAFLFSGGAAYTVGVIFYAMKKIKWTHCIWHLFVIMGSVLHFFSVFYTMPPYVR